MCVCVGLGCSYWYDVHPLHTCTLISPPPLPAPASEPAQASTFAMMMTMVLSKFAPDEGVFIDFLTGSGSSTEGCASTWPSVEKWSSSGSQEDVKSEYFSKEGWAAWLAAVTEKGLTLQGLGWEAAAPVAEVKAAAYTCGRGRGGGSTRGGGRGGGSTRGGGRVSGTCGGGRVGRSTRGGARVGGSTRSGARAGGDPDASGVKGGASIIFISGFMQEGAFRKSRRPPPSPTCFRFPALHLV